MKADDKRKTVLNQGFFITIIVIIDFISVSNSTHYENLKGDTKCRKCGSLSIYLLSGLFGAVQLTGRVEYRT